MCCIYDCFLYLPELNTKKFTTLLKTLVKLRISDIFRMLHYTGYRRLYYCEMRLVFFSVSTHNTLKILQEYYTSLTILLIRHRATKHQLSVHNACLLVSYFLVSFRGPTPPLPQITCGYPSCPHDF